ncbi:MAG: hypothetical protein ACFE0J_13725 [Elainellaceae cyanobacterium]
MTEAHVSVLPIRCHLSHLSIVTEPTDEAVSCSAIEQDEGGYLSVTVMFEGAGAIALMPLAPEITVEFYAKPVGLGDDVELGRATTQAIANVFTYTPTLSFESASKAGLQTGHIYRIGAILRVGSPDWVALIHGFIETLIIEIYTNPNSSPNSPKSSDAPSASSRSNSDSKIAEKTSTKKPKFVK